MVINLDSMSRNELLKLQDGVAGALAELEAKEKKAALAAAEQAAAALGFSLAELTGNSAIGRKAKKAAKPSPAKYANPSDASQTWTGKGRRPEWFKAALAAGTTPDSMEI